MSKLDQLHAELLAALKAVPGVNAYEDNGASVQPPAVIVNPATLDYVLMGHEPSDATLSVALVVRADGQAYGRMRALIGPVVTAIDTVDDLAVRRATPGSWPVGGSELPAYLIEIEAAL